ncbi:thiol:disulfide interchange protein DsbC [Alteromonadaceae bacterium 2753L.S.0a.02]|nr:thiol:disulfide interchange protein DsbC [Alteromonadaceae bacterium 2753L.S.0a.02]
MKNYLPALFVLGMSTQPCVAETTDEKIQEFFGDTPVSIKNYNSHFKQINIGTKTYFASVDGKYLFAGPIYDVAAQQDIVANVDNERRQARLAQLPDDWKLSYPATGEVKHEVTVFTDIDCPFCRKMHNHMQAFNDQGITVNYVMLPRAGIGSASYQKAVAASCATEPTKTFTQAMNGTEISHKNCDNTVAEQYQLAQELGIRATPATVLPNGKLQMGLMAPEQLLHLLESQ